MKRTLFGLVVLVGMTAPGQQTGVLLKHLSSWNSDIEPLNNGTASVCGGTFPRSRLRGSQGNSTFPSGPLIRSCEGSVLTETAVGNLCLDNPAFVPASHQAN